MRTRSESPPTEKQLWAYIRGGVTGARFWRQAEGGPHGAGFVSFDPRIAIEIDVGDHSQLESNGFTIIRVRSEDVVMDPLGVVGRIADVVAELRRPTSSPLPGSGRC